MTTQTNAEWLDELTAKIASGDQDLDLVEFARLLSLGDEWDWSDVLRLLDAGELTRDGIAWAVNSPLS